jgi:hypothetical protein
MKKTKKSVRRQILKIELVQHFPEGPSPCGFGYLEGQLVEFTTPERGRPTIKKITLLQSLDWMIEMTKFEEKCGEDENEKCWGTGIMQNGEYEAQLRWYRSLLRALKAKP